MKILDTWYFKNEQNNQQILQPNYFTPLSHLSILYKGEKEEVLSVDFYIKKEIFCIKQYETLKDFYTDGKIIKIPTELNFLPTKIIITYKHDNKIKQFKKSCKYATISGRVTDFSGKGFPSSVVMYQYGFDKSTYPIGCWTDSEGRYKIKIPCGKYNAFYADDNSYGKSTLECWGWNINVSKNRTFNFTVGNGEVYSLNVFADNGGMNNLFIVFRPMSLTKKQNKLLINDKEYNNVDICPTLTNKNINILLNEQVCELISLQRFYNTSSDGIAIANYIAQIEKPTSINEKHVQTLELTFSVTDQDNNIIQGKGITEFKFKDIYGTKII